jgi:hypothetical protein
MATVWTSGHLGPGQLPPPCGHSLVLSSGGLRLVAQLSALPERRRLAAIGQEADRAPALKTVGYHRQEKAVEELARLQGQGLDAIALAPVAAGKAPLSVTAIDETVGGDGHAVGGVPQIVASLRRAGPGPLGITPPRLVI